MGDKRSDFVPKWRVIETLGRNWPVYVFGARDSTRMIEGRDMGGPVCPHPSITDTTVSISGHGSIPNPGFHAGLANIHDGLDVWR